MTFYLYFSKGQTLAHFPKVGCKDSFGTVLAKDYEAARKIIFETFGSTWSHIEAGDWGDGGHWLGELIA